VATLSEHRPHLLYLAVGFPPAAKSSAYRLRETANQFCAAGWDVTVINPDDESWRRDFGLDFSLMDEVDKRVQFHNVRLVRPDQETDIRRFSQERAFDPAGWRRQYLARSQRDFPERIFGAWKRPLIRAAEAVHEARPIDLVLATSPPYVSFAVARHMFETHGVRYAIDFRDGWSIDVVQGTEAFTPQSLSGKIEAATLADALAVWVVNEPIASHYRHWYPELAERIHVVRNGFDPASQPPVPRTPSDDQPLVFGYLGTARISAVMLRAVLESWRQARADDPLLADARFEFRGHSGSAADRASNGVTDLVGSARDQGVTYGGPVAKRDLAALYSSWDALVFMHIGGRYVTSGKVYEYMATGLPIVSGHAIEHDASVLLSGYPLWTGASGTDIDGIYRAFRLAAQLARQATTEERLAARGYAAQFERAGILRPAVSALINEAHRSGVVAL
jgi:glycosyltransferase involved in cell wall biosynthesis